MNIKRRSTGRGRLIESSDEWRAWARESEPRTLRGMLPSSPRCGLSRVGYATDRMVMTWLTIARLTVKLHESFIYRSSRSSSLLRAVSSSSTFPWSSSGDRLMGFIMGLWIFIWTGYLRVTRFDHFLFRSTVSCDMFLLLVVLLFNDRLIFNYSTFRVTIVQFYNFRGFFTSTRDLLFQYISWKVIEVSLATVFMEHLNKFANDVVDRYIWLSDSILYFTSRIVCEISWSSRRFCYIVRNGWSILLFYAYSLAQFIGRRISRMLLLWTFYLKKYIIYRWSIRGKEELYYQETKRRQVELKGTSWQMRNTVYQISRAVLNVSIDLPICQ